MSELLTTGKLKCLAVKPETHHKFSVMAAIAEKTHDQLLTQLIAIFEGKQ